MTAPERFEQGAYETAAGLREQIVQRDTFTEFLTLVGYDYLA